MPEEKTPNGKKKNGQIGWAGRASPRTGVKEDFESPQDGHALQKQKSKSSLLQEKPTKTQGPSPRSSVTKHDDTPRNRGLGRALQRFPALASRQDQSWTRCATATPGGWAGITFLFVHRAYPLPACWLMFLLPPQQSAGLPRCGCTWETRRSLRQIVAQHASAGPRNLMVIAVELHMFPRVSYRPRIKKPREFNWETWA